MRKQIILRRTLVPIVLIFAMLPVAALAEDKHVHAVSPGYEIVVGKDVTFVWSRSDSNPNPQSKFKLSTSEYDLIEYDSTMYQIWNNFPFGTGHWSVKVWRDSFLAPYFLVDSTSTQNFYHYNNLSNTTNYRPEPFEYRRGARLPFPIGLTVFYELTKDYRIDIASYFTDIEELPEPIDWDRVYEKTEPKRQDLYDHARALPDMDSDFLKLDDGVLTIKQGYRWDGTSNPTVGEETPTDLRSSCVHDAFYDLMRMKYLAWDSKNHFNWVWKEDGYMNRLVADTMHFLIAVQDEDKLPKDARSDWRTLRKLGRANTNNDALLYAFKFHVSELTAWVNDYGKVDLHWMPAGKTGDDPMLYDYLPHKYNIYRTTSDSSTWSLIGNKTFKPDEMKYHNDATVYFTDQNVDCNEIYYYWIRANDYDTDGDGWTDQEEQVYGPFANSYKWPNSHPGFNNKHYDESFVEAITSANDLGNALQLNGVDEYVISTSEPGIKSGNSWTLEARVYPESGNGLSTILALSGLDPIYSGNYTPLMYDGVNNRFCYSDGDIEVYNDGNSITPGDWYHLAVTIDGNDGRLYVNGVEEANFTTARWPEETPTFGIGASFDIDKDLNDGKRETGAWSYENNPFDFFKGTIDELRVWSVARTEQEIINNMSVPVRGDHNDLVALWHFDEPDGTHTAYDATINGRDGEVHREETMVIGVDAGADDTINEGDTFVGSGSFTDPDSDTWTATVDYGDGSGVQSLTLTTGKTFDLDHVYADNAIYTVTVKVTNGDGGFGIDTVRVIVNNMAPTVSIDSVDQPNPHFIFPVVHTLTFNGSFTDPGWLDVHDPNWNFDDGTTVIGTLSEENMPPDSTGNATSQHAYSAPGNYNVTLSIIDDEGEVGTDTKVVNVISSEEAVTVINNSIQDLPEDAFKNNSNNRKNAFSNKLDEVVELINAGAYQNAIDKIQSDILAKVDGYVEGNPKNDWIIDQGAQEKLCTMIDDLIAYLEIML